MGVWAVSLLTDQLSPTSLTTKLKPVYSEFDWLQELAPSRTIQCSTPQGILSAIPKYISGRTSYL